MVKVVYLILTHTNPEQILRLVRALRTGNSASRIVIHHSYSSSYLTPDAFEHFNNVHLVTDTVHVRWGDFSLTLAILRSIEWIKNNLEFDWLVLISGQDYPIQPVREIEKFLETTNYDGFISAVPLEKAIPCGTVECPITSSDRKPCVDCTTRYYYQYCDLPLFAYYHNLPTKQRNALERLTKHLNKMQSLIRIRHLPDRVEPRIKVGIRSYWKPFTGTSQCYKGSAWFTINHRCIQYLSHFIRNNPRFARYYRKTIHPDESFFSTILMNNSRLNIINDNKRFITWSSNKAPHPNILRKQDFHRIVNSNQHFARKFDSNQDADILNKLDEHIGVSLPDIV